MNSSETIPIADLSENAASVVDRVRDSSNPIIITESGEPAAVILSVETYERREQEYQMLLVLARGEKEIAAGVGHSLDDVLAEADALIASSRK